MSLILRPALQDSQASGWHGSSWVCRLPPHDTGTQRWAHYLLSDVFHWLPHLCCATGVCVCVPCEHRKEKGPFLLKMLGFCHPNLQLLCCPGLMQAWLNFCCPLFISLYCCIYDYT